MCAESSIGGAVTHSGLVRELNEVVQWMWLGIQLGVPFYTLKSISNQYSVHGDKICRTEMLSTWLDSHADEPTWAEVVSAIFRTGNKSLARRIANKYGEFCGLYYYSNNICLKLYHFPFRSSFSYCY